MHKVIGEDVDKQDGKNENRGRRIGVIHGDTFARKEVKMNSHASAGIKE